MVNFAFSSISSVVAPFLLRQNRRCGINKETKGLVDEVIAHVEKYEEYLRRCGVLAGRIWKSMNTQ
jgi:hypothetical protein